MLICYTLFLGHMRCAAGRSTLYPEEVAIALQYLGMVLQGYTNYQLDPSKGTYARVPNQAPPFMGVNPSAAGKYTSFAQAPAAGQSSANAQQVSLPPSAQRQDLCDRLESQTCYSRPAPGHEPGLQSMGRSCMKFIKCATQRHT